MVSKFKPPLPGPLLPQSGTGRGSWWWCQVAPDQISGLNSRLQFPGKSTGWRFSINRKVIMKLAWLVKLVVGVGRVPYRGVARCWHAPKTRGDAAREAN